MDEKLSLKSRFLLEMPGIFFLDQKDPDGLYEYLIEKGILDTDEKLQQLEIAGQGNMNLTLRAITDERSFILKQSRPWVEKYPSIPAPVYRTSVEGIFYKQIHGKANLEKTTPHFFGLDEAANIIVLEDLGSNPTLETLYQQEENLSEDKLTALSDWLVELHNQVFPQDSRYLLKNQAMRNLNHEHIFKLPLELENGIDLDGITPGLAKVGNKLKNNKAYVKEVRALGELYLSDGDILLHGDFYPGSWMDTSSGVKVIDPEFCFFGPAEFDLGVFLAHLVLSQQGFGKQHQLLEYYRKKRPGMDQHLVMKFAGAEIMRRLLGVAQLPLLADLKTKKAMLLQSEKWVLGQQ